MTREEIETLSFIGVYPEVDQIEKYLQARATASDLSNYKPIGDRFQVEWRHSALAPTLAEISRRSFLSHGVLLSAIVWTADSDQYGRAPKGTAGQGWYDLASSFGLTVPTNQTKRYDFWVQHVMQVHLAYTTQSIQAGPSRAAHGGSRALPRP